MAFIKDYIVEFNDMDRYGELSSLALMYYMEETAFYHIEENYGYKKMLNDNKAWILNKWRVKMDKYPNYSEKFKIKTWGSYYKGFRAGRDFIIFDDNDEILGKISSLWIYLDINAKRPRRIPKEIIDLYYDGNEDKNFNEFSDFEKENKYEFSSKIKIRRSDIDVYNHVNNKVFVEWLEESVDDKIYSKYKLKEFELNYLKEINLIDNFAEIKSNIVNEEDLNIEFNHYILVSDKDCFIGKTKWVKR
jgi:acyl-ACP thioesterase